MSQSPGPPTATLKPAHTGGPGVPTDALTSFGEALVKATASSGTGSAQLTAAFALGWQMAELYRPQRRLRIEQSDPEDLPGLNSLDDRTRIEILVDQLQAALSGFREPIARCGLPPVSLDRLRESVAHADEARRREALRQLHRALLGTLTAVDYRLGKTYGLGRALADTARKPTDLAGLRMELGAYRTATLLGWLDDLASALPPHVGHSVASSLEGWSTWVSQQVDGPAIHDAVNALRRQGELWRALLSGEKHATDMLDTDNYLDAARSLATHMRSVLRGVIRRFPLLGMIVVALMVGGLVLLVIGGGSQIVAGATSIIAAIGLTWKGLGGTLGALAGKLEQPLWETVLDGAIADAITLLPDNRSDHHQRRTLALTMRRPPTAPP